MPYSSPRKKKGARRRCTRGAPLAHGKKQMKRHWNGYQGTPIAPLLGSQKQKTTNTTRDASAPLARLGWSPGQINSTLRCNKNKRKKRPRAGTPGPPLGKAADKTVPRTPPRGGAPVGGPHHPQEAQHGSTGCGKMSGGPSTGAANLQPYTPEEGGCRPGGRQPKIDQQ